MSSNKLPDDRICVSDDFVSGTQVSEAKNNPSPPLSPDLHVVHNCARREMSQSSQGTKIS